MQPAQGSSNFSVSQLCQTHYERIDWEIMGDRYGGNIVESEVGKSDIPLKNHVSSNLVGPLDTHDEILKIMEKSAFNTLMNIGDILC